MTQDANSGRPYDLKRVLLPLIVYKAFVVVLVVGSFTLLPSFFSLDTYRSNFRWPENDTPTFRTALSTWDGQHYLYLSERGYEAGRLSSAFFPLWPLVIRIGSPVFLGDHLVAALVLANLFSILAFVLFHRLVWSRHGPRIADASLLFLLVYPGALFYSFPYSESLFLFLCVVVFVLLDRRRLLAASLVASALPLTRAVGIFIVVPLAYDIVKGWKESKRRDLRELAYLAGPVLGLGVYFGYMYVATGNPLEGFELQQQFIGRRSVGAFGDLGRLVRSLVTVTSIHDYLGSALDRAFFLALLASLHRAWKLDPRYFLFSLVMGVGPVMAGTFWCYLRFLAVVFPVFVVAADLLSGRKREGWKWLVLAALYALQVVLLLRHVNNYWAG